MSENSVILLEEISSSQADTESVVCAAETDIALSHHPHVFLNRKSVWREAGIVRVELIT